MTSNTTHYSGRYLNLVEVDGWEYVSRNNSNGVAVLIAVTDDQKLLLVEQYRTPVGSNVIELPAGLVGDVTDKDESLLTAAARELEEETGYQAEQLEIVVTCPSAAGLSDEVHTFVMAKGLTQVGAGGGDETEDITVHAVPVSEVGQWLKDKGCLYDPKILTALYWLISARD